MRLKARTDSTHAAIVKALRKVGCKVKDTSRVGGGFPDLVVRCGRFTNTSGGPSFGKYVLMEVKQPKGRLTEDQKRFIEDWPEVVVVYSVADALAAVGVVK